MSEPAGDRRRSARVGIDLPIELSTKQATHAAVAWDANDNGVMVFSPVGYPIGERVDLDSKGGWSMSAKVVWSRISLEQELSIPRITKSWNAVFALGLELTDRRQGTLRRDDEKS